MSVKNDLKKALSLMKQAENLKFTDLPDDVQRNAQMDEAYGSRGAYQSAIESHRNGLRADAKKLLKKVMAAIPDGLAYPAEVAKNLNAQWLHARSLDCVDLLVDEPDYASFQQYTTVFLTAEDYNKFINDAGFRLNVLPRPAADQREGFIGTVTIGEDEVEIYSDAYMAEPILTSSRAIKRKG